MAKTFPEHPDKVASDPGYYNPGESHIKTLVIRRDYRKYNVQLSLGSHSKYHDVGPVFHSEDEAFMYEQVLRDLLWRKH